VLNSVGDAISPCGSGGSTAILGFKEAASTDGSGASRWNHRSYKEGLAN